jgi:hypothetical protein
MDATDSARRLRAMWAYSLLDQEEFFSELGVATEAGKRMLRRTNASLASEDLLRRAAEQVGWPSSFATMGPPALGDDEPTLTERLEAVEHQLAALLPKA